MFTVQATVVDKREHITSRPILLTKKSPNSDVIDSGSEDEFFEIAKRRLLKQRIRPIRRGRRVCRRKRQKLGLVVDVIVDVAVGVVGMVLVGRNADERRQSHFVKLKSFEFWETLRLGPML